MNSGNESLINGLTVSLDWISITFTEKITVEEVIDFLGLNEVDFTTLPKGANGYKSQRRLSGYDIYILYDGNEDMGIHVDISGSSVSYLLKAYKETKLIATPFGEAYDLGDDTVLANFIKDVQSLGHFTRLDLAVDDYGCKYYSLDELSKKLANKCYVSKWRTYRELTDNGLYNKQGHTIYLGSVQSDIMLRIYDKQLEQNKGLDAGSEKYISEKWVRWELQLRGNRADDVAGHLLLGVPFGKVTIGILSYYFRIICLDDKSNRSRCTNETKWNRFIEDVTKLRLAVKHSEKTLEEKENWIKKQVAPTLAALVIHSGDINYLNDMAFSSMDRISSSNKELLKRESPELYNKIFV